MPRLIVLRFTKDIETVADAFIPMVKEPIVTRREEQGRAVIDIEGDFSHFVMEDLDMWEAHIKITIKDNRIEDAGDREARALISQGMPGIGEIMFSPTVAWVYKRVEVVTRTRTVSEKLIDGKVTEHNESEWEAVSSSEWGDITREFSQKVRISS